MADASLFEEATWGFHLQQAIEKDLKAWLLVAAGELDDRVQANWSWHPPS